MKKTTLLILSMLFAWINVNSQSYTSGAIQVSADYTVQFDVDVDNDLVTITLIGPDDRWLGVSPGTAAGNGMGDLGDEAIVFSDMGLEDRNMPAGTAQPNLDAQQDLSEDSNTTAGGVRTLVITRPIDTGDSNDFVFPSIQTTFPFLWVRGNSTVFEYHGPGNKGGAMANMTLSSNEFETPISFTISPNPAKDYVNINLRDGLEGARVDVYNVLGKRIMSSEISSINSRLNVSNWNSGIYLVRVSNGEVSQTKRLVKQ